MTDQAIELRSFGVSLAGRVILSEIDLALPAAGLTLIVGPAAGGKSTLLRTLAGLNDSHPSLATWGEVRLAGRAAPINGSRHAIPEEARPRLILQHARFYLDSVRENLVSALPNRARLDRAAQTELVIEKLCAHGLQHLAAELDGEAVMLPLLRQRELAIARALMDEPAVLLADEVTAGLEGGDALAIASVLRRQAERRAVVLVTHNQQLARSCAGTTILLAGGRVQDVAPTREFFGSPRTAPGREFVRTGGCSIADPGVPRELLEPDTQPIPLPRIALERTREVRSSPRGFFWVERGRLGGLPRPGIIDSLTADLEGLRQLGVSVLVTLEEGPTLDTSQVRRFGIRHCVFPIVDMSVPPLDAGHAFCARVAAWLREGQAVAIHCRAGLGRTGTMLACQLIWAGRTAREALESVRAINPRCVQSDAQVAFLPAFEASLSRRPSAAGEHRPPGRPAQP